MSAKDGQQQTVADNRKARHDYFIDESYEAGIVLTGSEIKSIRAGRANLRGGYARVMNGEVWLYDVHISPYEQSGTYFNHEPTRPRKLLLHRQEIDRLRARVDQERLALVPLSLYFKDGRAKLELGLGRGRSSVDKRQVLAKRDAELEARRAMAAARRR